MKSSVLGKFPREFQHAAKFENNWFLQTLRSRKDQGTWLKFQELASDGGGTSPVFFSRSWFWNVLFLHSQTTLFRPNHFAFLWTVFSRDLCRAISSLLGLQCPCDAPWKRAVLTTCTPYHVTITSLFFFWALSLSEILPCTVSLPPAPHPTHILSARLTALLPAPAMEGPCPIAGDQYVFVDRMNVEWILNSDILLILSPEGIISGETYFQLCKLEKIFNSEK